MFGTRTTYGTLLALALTASACANYQPKSRFRFSPATSSAATSQNTPSSSTGTGNGSWGQGTASTTNSQLRCDVGIDPEVYTVNGVGFDDVIRYTFMTHRTLKVRWRAEVNGTPLPGTNFTPQYSMFGVYFQVFETEQATPMLYNGTYGRQQLWSPVLDFNGTFPSLCPNNDSSCRQPVEIQITKPNSDYLYPNTGFWTHVQEGHTWEISIAVETDDTNSLGCPGGSL